MQGNLGQPGLLPAVVDCLGSGYTDLAELAANQVIPAYGKTAAPYIAATFNPAGKSTDARRLRALRRVDRDEARLQARRSLANKHPKLLKEVIHSLAGSEDDADWLIGQTRAKPSEIRFAAYSALAGITTDRVVDTVCQDVREGKQWAAWAMTTTPHPRYSHHCVEVLSRFEDFFGIETPPPADDEKRLWTTFVAACGQEGKELDEWMERAVLHAALGDFDKTISFSNCRNAKQFLTQAIAVSPLPRAQRCLIEHRDAFELHWVLYAMCAASWHDDLVLFDIFSPYLSPLNNRRRCRGWYCGGNPWSCSLVSAVEFALDVDFLAPGYWGKVPLPSQLKLIERIREDPRWQEALKSLGPPA